MFAKGNLSFYLWMAVMFLAAMCGLLSWQYCQL
jgi:hypothetical protein